jgi:hypothetical protein
MRYPLRRRVCFALLLLPAVFAAPVMPLVAGEIFKCVAKDGTPLYQNFPCGIDSLGWSPSNPTVAKTAPMPGGGSQDKPKTKPVSAASIDALPVAGKPVLTGEPSIGMRADEVRVLWGEPAEMVADEPAEGGPVSVWRYADGRSVQFDSNHHVLEVRR